MSTKIANLARLALRQQVEFLGDGQVSLDSLWRAWGSPAGHDPRRWAELAAPLLGGFAAYLANLESGDRAPEEDATALGLARGVEGPVALRRHHEPRVHRLGLRQLSR